MSFKLIGTQYGGWALNQELVPEGSCVISAGVPSEIHLMPFHFSSLLINEYDNVSVVKMDIEGSEYSVIESLVEVPSCVRQFCVEFHHFCTDKTIEDTKNAISKLKSLGFDSFVEKPSDKQLSELTFWR